MKCVGAKRDVLYFLTTYKIMYYKLITLYPFYMLPYIPFSFQMLFPQTMRKIVLLSTLWVCMDIWRRMLSADCLDNLGYLDNYGYLGNSWNLGYLGYLCHLVHLGNMRSSDNPSNRQAPPQKKTNHIQCRIFCRSKTKWFPITLHWILSVL